MRISWLPDVLRAAGLVVNTYPGWQTRGSEQWGPLVGVVCHATAGSRTSTDAGEMRVLWETGSTSAPVPISQLYLSRSGAWWVGATGRCNHVLVGTQGPLRGYGNASLIGIEAANDNRGEPWSAHMLDSYQRGVAAICRQMGWGADRVVAHREHQSDKSDPFGIDMQAFRAAVARLIREAPSTEEDEMKGILLQDNTGIALAYIHPVTGELVWTNAVSAEAVGGWQQAGWPLVRVDSIQRHARPVSEVRTEVLNAIRAGGGGSGTGSPATISLSGNITPR